MIYLLDTNICIYIIKGKHAHITEKIKSHSPDDIKISVITVAELMYGCCKSDLPDKNASAVKGFLSPFEIIDFNTDDAVCYGNIRAELESKGKIIGSYDMQITAQALNRKYTVVTNNIKEFERVRKLNIENWL